MSDAAPARTPLFIHAGFPKTGSTALQKTLARNGEALRRAGFHRFDGKLALDPDEARPGQPIQRLQKLRDELGPEDTLTERMARELARLAGRPGAVAMMSSENLRAPNMARMFRGLDEVCDPTVVFYIRPQHEFLPSAWAQWRIGSRVPLADYIENCLAEGSPDFERSVSDWREALPKARILLRPLDPETLAGGDIAIDFLSIAGAGDVPLDAPPGRDNVSLDVSLIHALANRPADMPLPMPVQRLKRAIGPRLPEHRRGAGAPMIPLETAQRIEARFRDSNLRLFRQHMTGVDVDALYARRFVPRPVQRSYLEMEEDELLRRCFDVLLDSGMDRGAIHGALNALIAELARGSGDAKGDSQ